MPDSMPGPVAKGQTMREIERVLNDPSYRTMLPTELQKPNQTMDELLEKVGFNDDIRWHLVEHIFKNEPPALWPTTECKEDVVREGLLQALDVASTDNLPISCLWVCAGHHFQVVVDRAAVRDPGSSDPQDLKPAQVTVLFLTPSVPQNIAPPDTPNEEDLWIAANDPESIQIELAGKYPVGDKHHQPIGPRPPGNRPKIIRERMDGNVRRAAVFHSRSV